MYEERSLTEWMSHFNFDDALKALITDELGVRDLDDLTDVYEDTTVLASMREALPYRDFIGFLDAPQLTLEFSCHEFATEGFFDSYRLKEKTVATQESHIGLNEQIEKVRNQMDEISAQERKTGTVSELQEQLDRLRSEVISMKRSQQEKKVLQKKIRDTRSKKTKIYKVFETLKVASSLDLAFVVDCTGSMRPYLRAVATQLLELVNDISNFYPDVPLRLAFIGYRDYCDLDQNLNIFSFDMSENAFRDFVLAQVACGGCGNFANVLGALSEAESLNWMSVTRILYHIGDTPGHGEHFHSDYDIYPNGDPTGLSATGLLPKLKLKNILYFFGKVSSMTDQMISVFNNLMGGEFVKTVKVESEDLMTSVALSVTASMTLSVSSSASTVDESDLHEVVLDTSPNEPDFSTIKSETVVTRRMMQTLPLDEIIASFDQGLCLEPTPHVSNLKVAPLPFAKGSCRAAYKATDGKAALIHKSSMSRKKRNQTEDAYEAVLYITYVASAFAQEFSSTLSRLKITAETWPSVKFIDTSLVHYIEREGHCFALQEPVLKGVFQKFNNNAGMVSRKDVSSHEIVQAYSHFSHHRSGGEIMVVDCQGVFDASEKTFLLTDPAIHCKDVTIFGGCNLGN